MIDPRTELWAMHSAHLEGFVNDILGAHERRKQELSSIGSGNASLIDASQAAMNDIVARQPSPEEAQAYFDGKGRWHQYDLQDGVAVIDIKGPVLKSVHWIYRYYGIVATDLTEMREIVEELAANEDVQKVHVRIDSPGGTVQGTKELADAMASLRASGKRVITHADGIMASAALWIGVQADVVGATEMTEVGSIGAYCVMYDTSEAADKAGVKVHVVNNTGATVKGAGVPGTVVTTEMLDDEKRIIDAVNDKFVAAVASGRDMTEEAVRAINTGQTWLAEQAKNLGLIDGVFRSAEDSAAAPSSHTGGGVVAGQKLRKKNPQAEKPAPKQGGTMDTKIMDLVVANPEHASLIRDLVAAEESVEEIIASVEEAKAVAAKEAEQAALVQRAETAEAKTAELETAFAAEKEAHDETKGKLSALEDKYTKLEVAQSGAAPDVGPTGGSDEDPKTTIAAEDFDKLDPKEQYALREKGVLVIRD